MTYHRWLGIFAVVGGILFHLTLGTLYTWGNISIYVISAMRYFTPLSVDPPRLSYAAWVVATLATGQCLGMPLGGLIERYLGSRLTSFIGGAIMCTGIFISQFTLGSDKLFLFTYGVMYGFGIGIAYTSPLNCAIRWFPRYKGLISGIIVAGFGGGASIFNQVQTFYVNPGNLSPSFAPYPQNPLEKYFNSFALFKRVKLLFPFLAIFYITMQIVGCSLLFKNPEEGIEEPPSLTDEESEVIQALEKASLLDPPTNLLPSEFIDFEVKEALKSASFYALMMLFFLNGMAISFLATFWKVIGTEISLSAILISDRALSLIGSFGSGANAFGRIAWGSCTDRFGIVFTASFLSTFWALSLLALPFVAQLGSFPYGVVIFCNFFCLGGNFSIFFATLCKLFGKTNIGIIYGIFFVAQLFSAYVVAIFSHTLYNSLGPLLSSVVFSFFPAMAALLAVSYRYFGIDILSPPKNGYMKKNVTE
ncbi:transporter, major facilitator family protein [Cardiosporidium cionae]|uniref:Transporter, major facilitator family protein n=1 Tax=Cardiosporidium cionae TaxID=476202 RepID=A0ABQ7JDF6_9APIC|nr:transporter, major facilitator family protein [Cardiosporidium cionae]|eukprot:KAF8822057.1 transporter, major facilitator family protein [Cardiosporidium cionae]